VLTPGSRQPGGSEADDPAALARALGEAWSSLGEYKGDELRADVERDAEMLRGLHDAVAAATIHNDPKLDALSELLTDELGPEDEKDLLVTTDVLSEGQNLQQARYIVNYDMPWNPMRLVQRNGRIDRLNSPFAGETIYLYNLFPAGELEEVLRLYDRLLRKIAHANISVGMEAPVFEDAAAIERNFAD